VKVTKVFTEEFGLRTVRPRTGRRRAPAVGVEESIMLTGDLNILDVRWIVQFKIKDAANLMFKTADPVDNIRDISEVVMRRFVGDYSVDEVLTTKREEINDLSKLEMQKILDSYQTGVEIVTVKLQDVNPPREGEAGL